MENLEEVLQALDEFQKMRPSEIPRELEDYLCWVAKTGDPVYQWSLIKTLFREKLTRVMTDFYESCPTLELAPCPNVEHFNYDTMKSNLLERLESFANAPFTVQRICELLTAPQKNILVVSTREPGPIARRNENGDGMVNGSVDEDTSATQPPQDVEMEYWEKDCPSTVTISVHTVENEAPMLQTVVPTTAVAKNVFGAEEVSQEKAESMSSKADITGSNFVPNTSEFSGVSNLTSQTQTQEPQIEPTIQNLSSIVSETSGITNDVPEGIMNEDTSSQPSLDLENEDGDGVDSTRKLQTTFQTKDFSSSENKSSKFYLDNSKVNEKMKVGSMQAHVQEGPNKVNDVSIKSDMESKSINNKESMDPVVDNLLNTSDMNFGDTAKSSINAVNTETITDAPGTNIDEKETLPSNDTSTGDTSSASNSNKLIGNLHLSAAETVSVGTSSASISKNPSTDVKNVKDQSRKVQLIKELKPIVEEPCSEDDIKESTSEHQEKESLTITEAIEDDARVIKSIVPEPIPIIEEPKDAEPVSVKEEDSTPIVELLEESENQNPIVACQSECEEKMSIESSDMIELQGNNIATIASNVEDNDTIMETVTNKKEENTAELMEVDDEETSSMFQQDDEPMEQEITHPSQS
ncbi:uncharacterized protein LOC116428294 isoform X2 [Nomia melanderi]|uniref:uncharacterized protein LOC116428294 isoform X2 n=1 Tax=Nomia melanderi TaxID=2448451 RepID=UPI0013044AA6|nr:serine/threonine-protein phosphatase 4 regulatory subunit 2 isoform X2 [Nomia melanderi]